MALTSQQCEFFHSFGYLVLPGLLADDVDWMAEEHGKVFEKNGVVHDGTKRSFIVPFIDQTEKLCTLLDHPKVLEVLGSLLGDDFNYVGSDGSYYSGSTNWHDDGGHRPGGLTFAKFHIYLDTLTRDTGCIRVIPGSHLSGGWRDQLRKNIWLQPFSETIGVLGSDIPCVAIGNQPGDVAVLNHTTYHATFGGGPARRHFDLNLSSRAKTEEELADLEKFILPKERTKEKPSKYAPGVQDIMLGTATPERMRHLEQVIERENLDRAAWEATQ